MIKQRRDQAPYLVNGLLLNAAVGPLREVNDAYEQLVASQLKPDVPATVLRIEVLFSHVRDLGAARVKVVEQA